MAPRQEILLSASRPTTAGHISLAGADPAGFTRRYLPDRLNSRGSFVMIPSTPIAVSLAIRAASSTVHTYSSPAALGDGAHERAR